MLIRRPFRSVIFGTVLMRLLSCLLIVGLDILLSLLTSARGVAGPRVFINTLTVDDPAVADEAAFPTVT